MTEIKIKSDEIAHATVNALLADERNVKKHDAQQIEQLKASIQRFGFNDPIAVDQNLVVVEGHGRLMAAQQMGMEIVPVLMLTFADDAERRAYAIAHNQTQMLSPLDNDIIMDEFQRLGVGAEDYKPLGFTDEDVLFMSYEAGASGDGAGVTHDDDTQEAVNRALGGSGDGEGAGGGFRAPAIVRTVMKFDTQEQLLVWYSLMDWLRNAYPDALSLAERLDMFVADHGPETE